MPARPATDAVSAQILDANQQAALEQLVSSLDAGQLTWVAEYLKDLAASQHSTPASNPPIAIVHASQTGNGTRVAQRLHAELTKLGISAELWDVRRLKVARLMQMKRATFVVSTHGEGEPPDSAQIFYRELMSKRAPRLEGFQFSVLALGDRGYEHFCKTGRDVDARLGELGATRLLSRIDCDLDYEAPVQKWITDIGHAFRLEPRTAPTVRLATPTPVVASRVTSTPATVVANEKITGRASSKDVRHIELQFNNARFQYQSGDSISVAPRNASDLVDALVERAALSAASEVNIAGETMTLREALAAHLEITVLTPPLLGSYAAHSKDVRFAEMLANPAATREYSKGRDLIDLMTDYPPRALTAEALIGILRKLPRRSYSIASSLQTNPSQVHLTVGLVEYETHGRQRRGIASNFLADLPIDATLDIHLEENANFRPPSDPTQSMIMIGAGTGIAPYRAFIEDWEARGASGQTWLLFGDRTLRSDFLYQSEWLDYRERGLLSRLDLAFSRDSGQKVYVQHRLRQHASEIYRWLESGAYLYVCGDANHMARDVHTALLEVIQTERNCDPEAAFDYVGTLTEQGRYQRDVY